MAHLDFLLEAVNHIFIDGKNYNPEKNLTPQEQLYYVKKDLADAGFTQDGIDKFIKSLKTIEDEPIILDLKESKRWLQHHAEFKDKAISLLDRIKKEINKEKEINFSELKNKK